MTKPVVLIVEDEALIRMDAALMLEDAGYSVIDADNADDAITLLEDRADVRAVFTDIEMPGSMDGLKLARVVRSRWPIMTLIVTSGRVLPWPEELPEDTMFLPKPYSAPAVLAALQLGSSERARTASCRYGHRYVAPDKIAAK